VFGTKGRGEKKAIAVVSRNSLAQRERRRLKIFKRSPQCGALIKRRANFGGGEGNTMLQEVTNLSREKRDDHHSLSHSAI